ncbi:DUF6894 family protein [Methylobacterium gnaphalii]|uniref:DUF6894 domain-containing protein n=1 Tax=Methylobacterium gnaphalii TaxID=1010610 RepID=A0A512JGD2_9HYPH|nr:hypothetical protein [Methylobacterium gnaphalii]GEP09015.1 hypothetical protein MGN01_08600 [Methylobacterium gnaphalii]GJD67558.1 hypothetical protein MMMDOFMJ_0474 [Methylobacterium gnaphalii]GLS48938.1 hypothetical protein GCM10007885_17850 [Methylobacterium gnaphalii]
MPRYYFDVYDGQKLFRDEEGGVFDDRAAMRAEAMKVLPDIARDGIPQDGDRQSFTVRVRNERNLTIYTGTILFSGLWLDDSANTEQKVY